MSPLRGVLPPPVAGDAWRSRLRHVPIQDESRYDRNLACRAHRASLPTGTRQERNSDRERPRRLATARLPEGSPYREPDPKNQPKAPGPEDKDGKRLDSWLAVSRFPLFRRVKSWLVADRQSSEQFRFESQTHQPGRRRIVPPRDACPSWRRL